MAIAQNKPLLTISTSDTPLAGLNILDEITLGWDGNGIPDMAALVEGKAYASADLLLFSTDREAGQAVLETYVPDFAYFSALHPGQKPALGIDENQDLIVFSYEEQGAVRWDFNTTVTYRGGYRAAGYDDTERTIGEATPYLECRVDFLTGKGTATHAGVALGFDVPTEPVMADRWRSESLLPPEC